MTEQIEMNFDDVEIEIFDDDQDVLLFTNEKPADALISYFGDNKRVDIFADPNTYPWGFKSENHGMFVLMYRLAEFMNSSAPGTFSLEEFLGFHLEVHDLAPKQKVEVEIE